MKNFDSRTYSINDFLEWEKNGQLELNPRFQRRSVWTDSARSYLMDTIVRGKPIPKVFIRQKLNVTTKKSIREIVDGQQRMRTILAFVKDGFQISKRHNPTYGGRFFSQLISDSNHEDIQASILNYEISVDLLVNMPDAEVLDVFSRLNSYAVILNEQEKLHALHFGPFKTLAESLGRKYNSYWISSKILTPVSILRMADANLTSDLLIAMLEGIKNKKAIKKYYETYESNFPSDEKKLEDKFDCIMEHIANLYPEGLENTEFNRPPLFYSLFTTIFHLEYGLKDFQVARKKINKKHYPLMRNELNRVTEIISGESTSLKKVEHQFREDSKRATTDPSVRIRRTNFLLGLLS